MTEEEKKPIVDAEIDSEESEIERELDELTPEEVAIQKDKKIKNLISALILLGGLFVGSLFVDIVQLVKGGGFSQRALNSTDVFATNGKTWVAFSDPIVKLQVVNDSTCGDACKPDEVLVGLKQSLPTLVTEKVDVNSAAGAKLVATFGLKTLPAFIFSKEIEKTDLFAKAQPFLDKQGEVYAIKSAEAGFPVGKYITGPVISDKDIKIGSDEAQVKVVVFSDFANPTDAKAYQAIAAPLAKDYTDKVQLVFKNYFPPTSTNSLSAALASQCANEQGKFSEYADKLFASQATWSKVKDAAAIFKGYALTLKLNSADFNKCLDSKKYNDQITAIAKEGQGFGIQATPSIFVGADLQKTGATYDDLKKAIDSQLNK